MEAGKHIAVGYSIKNLKLIDEIILSSLIYCHQLGPLGRVGHRVAMSVCVSVCMSVILKKGQSIRFFLFLYQIEYAGMVLRILNLKGHQSCMFGSKVTKVSTTFFCQ